MTREEILILPAGPELDKLVAATVMSPTWEGGNPIPNHDGRWSWSPPYSTDIAAAWLVFERFKDRGWDIGWHGMSGHPGWLVSNDDCDWLGYGDTAPLAICRAALLTTGQPTPHPDLTIPNRPC